MRQPLSQQAENLIRELILERGLRPGDPLPSEGEIAKSLEMSKPTVREGVRRLETLGVVEVRHGRGLFVGALSLDPIVKHLPYTLTADQVPLADLLQVRQSLEAGLVASVIPLSTPAWLQRLDDMVQQMYETETTGSVDPVVDQQFHLALFEPLGNRLVLQLIDVFWQAFTRASESLPRTGGHTAADHAAIVDSIHDADPEAAVRAVRDHFADVVDIVGSPEQARRNGEASAS